MRKSIVSGIGLLLAAGTVWAQQYLITTVAGVGVQEPSPKPTLMWSVPIGQPKYVAADAAGTVYFSVRNSVLKVDVLGVLTLVAGSWRAGGYSGDGGPATGALLNNPSGVAVDGAGNVYISDGGNNAIRKVAAATGIITTIAAGTGGGPLAVDNSGNVYLADTGGNMIRKVTAAGSITTVAGNGTAGYSGDGGPAASAQISGPSGVAADGSGNIYIADEGNAVVRKVAATTGIITTVHGLPSNGPPGGILSVAVDGSGNLYVETHYAQVTEVAAATGAITSVLSNPFPPYGDGPMAVDSFGNLYIINGIGGGWIWKVAAVTKIMTPAVVQGYAGGYSGDGGTALSAALSNPQGVAVDGSGNLYFVDSNNLAIREVAAATGIITTVAGGGAFGYSGDGGPATSARLEYPAGVAVDGAGNVYFVDSGPNVVRKVTAATGTITTVAGNGSAGYSGDGGPATSAQLSWPVGLAVDAAGNMYIADSGNYVVRKVMAATGTITTVAGNGGSGYSGDGGPATGAQINTVELALDGSGNLYLVDLPNCRVRKVAAETGIIATVAGNGTCGSSGDGSPATGAQLNNPTVVAVDGSGNLFIGESGNYPDNPAGKIREVVAATGIITTIAGNGTQGYSGDGGPATGAQFSFPGGLAVDAAGNVYVTDGGNDAIRMLVPEASHALLSIASNRSASFARGQTGALYSVAVSSAAGSGPTSGAVTVTETLPAGLTLESMSGAGWTCSGVTCVRGDVLSAGASYPPITVTVHVAVDAPSLVTNQVTVSGGGARRFAGTDLTEISGPPTAPVPMFPANGATGASVAPTLVWTGSGGAISYDVYFGISSSPPLVTSTTGTSYVPGTLTSDTTYYWQIVARSGLGSSGSAIWSFTTGVTPIGLRFVPVAPCRVVDTRGAGGPFGGPTMAARSVRSFAIPSSGCGIPATAQAYSLNVTVVPAGALSFLTLWPTGQSQPVVSTLNSFAGTVVANAAIVPAGEGGAVNVFVSGDTDVILDIDGYFDATWAAPSWFYAVAPCRLADTRGATGPFGGPSLVAGQTRDFPVPLSSCGIPAAATAYSLNVTAIPGTDSLSYLTAFPTGASRPFVSTLNSWTGEVRANAALVPVGANDSVSVFVTDPADVILDINGYFERSWHAGALAFYPLTPCRVVDTRGAAGALGGPEMEAKSVRSFALPAGGCPVPSNAAAYSMNVTVVPDGPLPYLTAWPAGAAQPQVSTLNSFDGEVVANAAIVPAGDNGAVSIYVTNRTQVILDINGYFAP